VSEQFLDEEGVPTAPEPGLGLPDEPAAEPDGAEPAPGHRARQPWRTVAALALVAAVGLGLLAAVLGGRLNDERSERRAVQDASGRFASALLTYDFNDLPRAKQRVLALSTGKFRREYEQAFDGGLDTLFRETQARSAGTVTDVFVGEIEDGSVTTIAVVDAVARGTTGSRRLISSYIELQLVKVKGEWKVDGVTNLNLGAGSPDTPLPTTTITAPPK
jgi:Mce-associated membrane protein